MSRRNRRSCPSDTQAKLARRDLLRVGAAGALAGVLGPRLSRARAATRGDAPELTEVSLGIIAVQSCAPIVVALEKGFFKKHGLEARIRKETSWAAARDKLVSGENHASHLKFAQPFASTLGLLGAPKVPMIAPFTLSRRGSVFMFAAQLKGKLTADPKTWKATIDEWKGRGEPFTIALPLPFGFHGLMYRYFLATAGIHADKEIKLITLPPAQMVQNMRVGTMQACALVEPWGVRGVSEKVSLIAMYGHELWQDHPVKTLGMLESFAEQNPKTARAILRAVKEAAVWCDQASNRAELVRILATPSYLNSPAEALTPALAGRFDWGDGRTQTEPRFAIDYSSDTSAQPREAKWFLTQFRRWGMCEGELDYDAVVARVTRPELHAEAMKELGAKAAAPSEEPLRFFDGQSFDPKHCAEYAKSFAIHSLKG